MVGKSSDYRRFLEEQLKKLDVDLAEKVISNKKKLAKFNIDVQEEALRLIALYQPI